MLSKSNEIFPWNPNAISGKNPAILKNYVNGEWKKSKQFKDVINPLNGSPFIKMPDTQEDEIKPFLEELKRCPKYGLHNPYYNPRRYRMYGDICRDMARYLRSDAGNKFFTELINLVMPKGLEQCKGEVDCVAAFLETFSGNGVRNLAVGQTTPGNYSGEEPRDYRWPFGPVAVITPFNFPLEIMALQLMGALFMGNKPVLKQASTTSIVAEAFVRLLLHCGMPKDDMLLIHCPGSVMEKLVSAKNKDNEFIVKLTQFTGGSDVAKKLLKITEGRVKIEDAGFDWKILGPHALSYPLLSTEVAEICDKDAYAASGQKCSAQSILFIHENWGLKRFIVEIHLLAGKRNLGDLSIGPVLTWTNKQIQSHIEELLKINGAYLFFGGKPLTGHKIPSCYGAYKPTAVFVPLCEIMPNFKIVTTEVFGPVQVVTSWSTKEDLDLILKMCDRMDNHLTAAIVDDDPLFINHVVGRTVNGTTYAGRLAPTTGAPEWHHFGPCGHPGGAIIGTPKGIIQTWSQERTIIFKHAKFPDF